MISDGILTSSYLDFASYRESHSTLPLGLRVIRIQDRLHSTQLLHNGIVHVTIITYVRRTHSCTILRCTSIARYCLHINLHINHLILLACQFTHRSRPNNITVLMHHPILIDRGTSGRLAIGQHQGGVQSSGYHGVPPRGWVRPTR